MSFFTIRILWRMSETRVCIHVHSTAMRNKHVVLKILFFHNNHSFAPFLPFPWMNETIKERNSISERKAMKIALAIFLLHRDCDLKHSVACIWIHCVYNITVTLFFSPYIFYFISSRTLPLSSFFDLKLNKLWLYCYVIRNIT